MGKQEVKLYLRSLKQIIEGILAASVLQARTRRSCWLQQGHRKLIVFAKCAYVAVRAATPTHHIRSKASCKTGEGETCRWSKTRALERPSAGKKCAYTRYFASCTIHCEVNTLSPSSQHHYYLPRAMPPLPPSPPTPVTPTLQAICRLDAVAGL